MLFLIGTAVAFGIALLTLLVMVPVGYVMWVRWQRGAPQRREDARQREADMWVFNLRAFGTLPPISFERFYFADTGEADADRGRLVGSGLYRASADNRFWEGGVCYRRVVYDLRDDPDSVVGRVRRERSLIS